MRLSAIEIENFKGVSQRQRIELKVLTLIYGPNSAGKSTIFHSLDFLSNALRGGPRFSPRAFRRPNQFSDFQRVVHRNDISRDIAVKLEYRGSISGLGEFEIANQPDQFLAEHPYLDVVYTSLVNNKTTINRFTVEVRVGWNQAQEEPYLKSIEVELGTICSQRNAVPDLGIELFFPENPTAPSTLTIANEKAFLLQSGSEGKRQHISPLIADMASFSMFGERPNTWQRGRKPHSIFVGNARGGALPLPGRYLQFDFSEPLDPTDRSEATQKKVGITRLLSEMLLAPIGVVRRSIANATHIGPLRSVPTARTFSRGGYSGWDDGSGAWDMLRDPENRELLANVNEVISSGDHLDTGYEIVPVELKEIENPEAFARKLELLFSEHNVDGIKELYTGLPIRNELRLKDIRNGTLLLPNEVGMGISQVLPVVVAMMARKNDLVTIEQPELHVHPRVQVELGDLAARFIDRFQESEQLGVLAIETHSEHLMLRLLRRVRETHQGELDHRAPSLTPEDFAVVYVEPGVQGARFIPLRVSADGDFLDRWPRGFFEERGEELF